MRIFVRALIVTGLLAMPVLAQAAGDDNNGYTQIMQGKLAAAEAMLVQQRRMFPGDADLTLNLAAIYANTGRVTQARALYTDVLRQPDQSMKMAHQRTASSHAIATIGLKRISATELTAR